MKSKQQDQLTKLDKQRIDNLMSTHIEYEINNLIKKMYNNNLLNINSYPIDYLNLIKKEVDSLKEEEIKKLFDFQIDAIKKIDTIFGSKSILIFSNSYAKRLDRLNKNVIQSTFNNSDKVENIRYMCFNFINTFINKKFIINKIMKLEKNRLSLEN